MSVRVYESGVCQVSEQYSYFICPGRESHRGAMREWRVGRGGVSVMLRDSVTE